jgi:TetR/AcrR family transcriptional regulator
MRKSKGTKKRQNGEETRAKILDAAEQIFAERGFASTSTREIGRLAGMDKYAIYYHFKNKETLYRAVIERSFSKITGFIDGIFPQEVVSPGELERVFEKILEYMARNTAIMKIMQRESLDCTNVGIAEIFQTYFKPLYRKGIRFSQAAKQEGVFKEEMHVRQFIVSLYTLIMSYYNDGAMISLLLGEDVLSKRMIKERKSQLAKFVMDNLAPAAKGQR